MPHIQELISYYNQKYSKIEFRYTNWREFFARVRSHGKGLKTFRSEITSPQFHRIHLSGMNSARADIKIIIDKAERSLTYETQPLMAMLDSLGIPYDQGIIDKSWYTLVNCQTHASATHIDRTNRWVKENALAALNYSEASKIYLMRMVAASLSNSSSESMPLVIFNTIPWKRDMAMRMTIISKLPGFQISYRNEPVNFSILNQEKIYGGVIRKDKALMNEDKWFYKTEIALKVGPFEGVSYKTFTINEVDKEPLNFVGLNNQSKCIFNDHYRIEFSADGIDITDKFSGKTCKSVIFLQDGGDEGDSYDYSYPDEDKEYIITEHFENAKVECIQTPDYASMNLKGEFYIPDSLESRSKHQANMPLQYSVTLELFSTSPIIRISGSILNQAKEHRTRLGFKTGINNLFSYAGTQFGYVQRECDPAEMKDWKEKGLFEEPCSTRPLLNHVSAVGEEYTMTIFTRSVKEYDFTDDHFSNIQVTLFRSVGYVGLPDLNRRPGRPSGLANKIFESPEHQMLGENTFDLGVCIYPDFNVNQIMRDYVEFSVDPMYYQEQGYEKTIYPISYFPINPWEPALPFEYKFLILENFTGSYGTIKKAEKDDGYILQIYNSGNQLIEGGELKFGFDCSRIKKVDLLEKEMLQPSPSPITLKNGELKNLLICVDKKEV